MIRRNCLLSVAAGLNRSTIKYSCDKLHNISVPIYSCKFRDAELHTVNVSSFVIDQFMH
jgi:hypothetical protein